MKIAIFLIVGVVVGVIGSENNEAPRDKRHLVLVPQPIMYVPSIHHPPSSVMMMHRNPSPPPVAVSVPCGSPAYRCQGSCDANGVGGITAVKGEYPWLAQLYTGSRFVCLGSIIDNYNILTSASCIEPSTPASVAALRVRLGDFKLNTNEDGQYVEKNVTTVYRHTDFQPQGKNPAVHDIAILRLTEPITFTEYIRPICIDDGTPRVDTGYVEGILAGYGKISYSNRPTTDVLHKVNVRIATPTECQSAYMPYGVALRDTHICAGTPTIPSVDPCVGGEGGPLFVKTGANTFEQVGIASYGISCAGPQAVYTRVSAYRAWIEQVRMQTF
ncbi:venom serine protease Bi-VSP [Folsomia candida]|uniref:venom serine protease Bi-VSP n=1 Tax=Folsomia candida TaxID=158441 RepID=UPI000B8F3068|nr:venom serine protease Bi-VSP [Folsomia candida]